MLVDVEVADARRPLRDGERGAVVPRDQARRLGQVRAGVGVRLDERQALGAIVLELGRGLAAAQVDAALAGAAGQDQRPHGRSEQAERARAPRSQQVRHRRHVIGPRSTMPEPADRRKAGSGGGARPGRCCRRCRRAGR